MLISIISSICIFLIFQWIFNCVHFSKISDTNDVNQAKSLMFVLEIIISVLIGFIIKLLLIKGH
jgi:hypothetical protein